MNDTLPYALPPDPNTRAPSWNLPADSCDTHFHIFGPPEKFPLSDTRRYTPPGAPLENYWKVQEVTGLTHGVAVQPTAHGFDNSAIMDAVDRSDGKMRGVIRFNEAMSDATLQELHERGARGARFSLMSDRPGSIENLKSALPRMEKLGWSLVLHVEPDHFVDNEKIIRGIPIPTVIDHMTRCKPRDGGTNHPAFALLLDLLKNDRFWVKIASIDKLSAQTVPFEPTSIPYSDIVPMGKAVIETAPDRVIWGSDWPHGNNFQPGRVPNEGDLLNCLGAMATDEGTRRKILSENPKRLYFSD
jgi:2-pyrone-4,6-dicarboxylate lactonase